MKENIEKMIPGLRRLAQIEQHIRDREQVPDSRSLINGLAPNEARVVKAEAGLKRKRVW